MIRICIFTKYANYKLNIKEKRGSTRESNHSENSADKRELLEIPSQRLLRRNNISKTTKIVITVTAKEDFGFLSIEGVCVCVCEFSTRNQIKNKCYGVMLERKFGL